MAARVAAARRGAFLGRYSFCPPPNRCAAGVGYGGDVKQGWAYSELDCVGVIVSEFVGGAQLFGMATPQVELAG